MTDLEWMAWTSATFVFVMCCLVGLLGITVLAIARPSSPRKGWLPIQTARGDRIYIGLLGAGLIFIGLIAMTSLSLIVGVVVSTIWMATIVRWG